MQNIENELENLGYNNRYTNLCAKLGDLIFKKTLLDIEMTQVQKKLFDVRKEAIKFTKKERTNNGKDKS